MYYLGGNMKISKNSLFAAFILSATAMLFSCGSTANLDNSAKKPAQSKPASSGGIASASSESSGSITASGSSVNPADALPPAPAKLTEAPKIDFAGTSLQVELENMYYDGFELVGDANASKSYALKLLNDSSWAIAEVNFPAGTYEAVANVLAPSANSTRFNLYINKDTYLLYGSEPPIGKYELTTRAPASFTLDQPTTVTVKIQQNDIRNPANAGQNGMTIDYLLFKKK